MRGVSGENWRRWQGEWRANPRLRVGGIAIAAILALYAALLLSDWRRELATEYEARTLQLYKVAALAGQQQWTTRAQDAADIRRALQAKIPPSTSTGLAQAEMQSWMNQVLRGFGQRLTTESKPTVRVDAGEALWKVQMAVRGPLSARQLLEILGKIEGSERLLVVEDIRIDNQQQQPTVDMTVSAYYRIGERKGAGNATP